MSVGVWQIIIIAVIVLGAVGIPAFAIATDNSGRSIRRQGWWLWTGVFVAFVGMISLFDHLASEALTWVTVGLALIFALILPWFMAQRFLWRVRDAGWSPQFAYLFIFPVINLIPWLLLLFVPTASAPQEKSSDQ
jgi:uncharacterized membrane protein YhaH (DUF805 family)